ncbi:bis(5'-nucleosyl)-tetraphosphatase (symmetrical) YqeK [Fructilactobacillus florum]|uniref:bis(5'-nucleosyl)-tetraphosphatase (symmetrical) n=1 Tax=Fructilactobacillus florum DSM 22689 = JCM 16035 TaxID=1423745 RepID=A0A0R2CV52_9LACO|nr:bis(5'-nucleosyl)-tetraphosphatase (symmetrical) YqeK [Fructilactobacillus florum]KRM91830.1 hypothetical protein FC87_GL000655 [Fructilactobacillus florum DSM 22689 = JCM 16035]
MSLEPDHYEQYAADSRAVIISKLKKHLDKNRFDHCVRVEATARELAAANGADQTIAGLAGLVHDYAKQRDVAEFQGLIRRFQLDPELLKYSRAIWHGYVGYLLVQQELGINDIRILNAVKYHTIAAPVMSVYDKIVYMADYLEPNRSFSGVEMARAKTQASLDEGVVFQNQQTMTFLIERGQAIYPAALEAYNALVPKS